MSLACAIGYFVSPDASLGHIIGSELGFKTKLALFSSLFLKHTSDPAAPARLKEFRRHAEKAELRRNRLIHSIYWPLASGPGVILRLKTTAKAAKGLDFEVEQLTRNDIEGVLGDLKTVSADLNGLIVDFNHDWANYVSKFYGEFASRLPAC